MRLELVTRAFYPIARRNRQEDEEEQHARVAAYVATGCNRVTLHRHWPPSWKNSAIIRLSAAL
jgi:hypothetical protein